MKPLKTAQNSNILRTALFSAVVLLLNACERPADPSNQERIRSVKTQVLTSNDLPTRRQLSGVVQTTDRTELSFRVPGRVEIMQVDQGDVVEQGDVLAQLETREFELAVQSAQAQLTNARADLIEKTDTQRRFNELKDKDFVSQAEFDQAVIGVSSAQRALTLAETSLENAERDLSNTRIVAPFDGTIAQRLVEPFSVVAAGKSIFDFIGNQGFEVDILMPESLIQRVSYGDPVTVSFPTIPNLELLATVSQIAARAEQGNAFEVKVILLEHSPLIRSGMTANAAFEFSRTEQNNVISIPLSAISVRQQLTETNTDRQTVSVFVFAQDTETAERRQVRIRELRGNFIDVVSGLNVGDELIVAGVDALQDGQRVKRWQPRYNQPATLER